MKRYFTRSLRTRPDPKLARTVICKAKANGEIDSSFVREKNNYEFNKTIAYAFLGLADYIDHYGAKPMNIHWALRESAPHYIWKEMAKMAVG